MIQVMCTVIAGSKKFKLWFSYLFSIPVYSHYFTWPRKLRGSQSINYTKPYPTTMILPMTMHKGAKPAASHNFTFRFHEHPTLPTANR